MANSTKVEWLWFNLGEEVPEKLDLQIKMVSLPEIEATKAYLANLPKSTSEEWTSWSAWTEAILESVIYCMLMAFFVFIGLKYCQNVGSVAKGVPHGIWMAPQKLFPISMIMGSRNGNTGHQEMQEESEMPERTRPTLLR